MRCFLLYMLVLVPWTAAWAQKTPVYRWEDEQGVVHFSQTPPRARAFEKLEDRGADLNMLPPAPVRPEYTRRTSGNPTRKKRSARPARDEVRRRCEQARRRVEDINARMRAGYRPAQGERLRDRLRVHERERYRWCIRRGG